MLRYIRLYAHFVRFSFSRAMEFRLDFFFRIAMDCLFYAVQLAFFGILYRHTSLLGGWNLDQAWVFVAGIFVADALQMTIFANNLWWLPIFVNRGDLDYYLVRPVSSLFFLGTRDFAANSFVNLLMALGVLCWALFRYPGSLGFVGLVLYALLTIVGMLLLFAVHMYFLIPVFWLQSSRGLDEIYWSIHVLSERPDRIFHGWVRRVLVSILPLALIISFPTRVVLGEGSAWTIVHMVGVTFVAWSLLFVFWNRGVRSYSSASS
ncbi:MAG: hypothetical protein CME06_04780 [Gemmatimonadetes bacterium]|nr:hypothetical protein [Gemmatimonadota bacterium]